MEKSNKNQIAHEDFFEDEQLKKEEGDIKDFDIGEAWASGGMFEKNPTLTYKSIVMKQIDKVREESSKELTKGGEHYIYVPQLHKHVPVSLPDQRKVVEQSIKCLYDLLLFHFDEIAQKKINKKLIPSIENAYRLFFQEYLKRETWKPFKEYALKAKLIPSGKESPIGEYILQELEDYKYECWREVYQELILLFKRKNELSSTTYITG